MKLWLALAVAAALVLSWWWQRDTMPVVRGVQVVVADVQERITNTRSGSIEACRRARLSVPTGGQISHINVKEGDRVVPGQLLLSLFNQDIQAQVKEARARLNRAQHEKIRQCLLSETDAREAGRFDTLSKEGLATLEQQDLIASRAEASKSACMAARAGVMQAEALIELYQAQLTKTRLHAPFGGTVAKLNGEVGEFATPSPPGIPTLPMIDLIDDSCLYVTAPIDEIDAGRLAIGQQVWISLDAYPNRRFNGTISRIAPYIFALEKQARTVDIEAVFEAQGERLLVGYSADVEIVIDEKQGVLTIPTEAIFDEDQVLVVVDATLERRTVTTGLSNWQVTEVLSGLHPGDWVVSQPGSIALAQGERVRIISDGD